MRKKYIKPSCTVIHSVQNMSIMAASEIPLESGEQMLYLNEVKREDAGEEVVDWVEDLTTPKSTTSY